MEYGRKEFHFDLDVELLKQHYPSTDNAQSAYKRAWSDIKGFMELHGFTHSQYSGYESESPMSYMEAYVVVDELHEVFPWFAECAQAATLTEIGERHDVLEYLHRKGPVNPRDPQEERGVSLHGEVKEARAASDALEERRGQEPDLHHPNER